jgi:lipoprotein-anchoring transpeptidase ErfK/SrfK
MPIRLLLLALLTTCLASTAGWAQHGKPYELRVTTPEVEDAAPGQEPAPEDKTVPEAYRRQSVFYRTTEAPGTIIIDTSERFLYLIQPNNTALRYGIGVGRDGFQWNGLLKVTRKAEWPDWTPPSEMIERQPYLPRFMAGGPMAIPWGRVRSIWATRCIASMAPTRRIPSGMRSRPAASGWSTSRSWISTTACMSAPR